MMTIDKMVLLSLITKFVTIVIIYYHLFKIHTNMPNPPGEQTNEIPKPL